MQNTYSNYAVSQTFQTYVMYQPTAATGSDSILVPLYEINWNWGANVDIVNGSWTNFGTSPLGGSLSVTSTAAQTQHPKWTMKVTGPAPPAW